MTQSEHVVLVNLTDEYAEEFSKLVADKLNQCPKHLRDVLLEMLQKKSSVFESEYDHYTED